VPKALPFKTKSNTQLPARNPSKLLQIRANALQLSKTGNSSSSALEQLDIERGVCTPFRKYTPEGVISEDFFFQSLIYGFEVSLFVIICC